nr:MAG: hypothetical protein 3 [Leviviridae sp.]
MDFNPEYAATLLNEDLLYYLNHENDIVRFRANSLANSFLKKYEVDSPELDRRSIDLFEYYNLRCLSFTTVKLNLFESLLDDVRDIIFRAFRPDELQSPILSLARCIDFGRCGPGSSIGTKHTDFYQKLFTSKLTVTDKGLLDYMIQSVSPMWKHALTECISQNGFEIVRGSRIATVPKNRDIKRVICTEPSINMFYQLGANEIIRGILRRSFSIDLSMQPQINASLARIGSIDGCYATIDLKSASDSISQKLIKRILPSYEYNVLDLIRSKAYCHRDEYYPFHLFSSMGNGFTFSLQTLIFASCVRSVYNYYGYKHVKTHVFGDDIVCHREIYDTLTSLLKYMGFEVNLGKSYADGPFRESCGSDFYKGINVRGVYLRKLKGASDVYSIFNRLTRWSAISGIALTNVLLYLKGLAKFQPVPLDEADTAGHHIPLSSRRNIRIAKGLFKYNKLEYIQSRKRVMSDGIVPTNQLGCFIAFLGGYVRNGRVTLRSNVARYKVVPCVTPRWDYTGDARYTAEDIHDALAGVVNIG